MYTDITQKLLSSDNPAIIEWQVQQALQNGLDLCDDPFVMGGHFCQWMTERETPFEYKLISAFTPSEFAETVRTMRLQAYDLALKGVDWYGMRFQWMARVRAQAADTAHASHLALPAARVQALSIIPGFNMVERVQVLGTLSFSTYSFGDAS